LFTIIIAISCNKGHTKWGMRMSAISCCKQRTYRCAPGCLAELTLLIYRTFVIQLWTWSCLSDFAFCFYT
jgi:hypothetical protein